MKNNRPRHVARTAVALVMVAAGSAALGGELGEGAVRNPYDIEKPKGAGTGPEVHVAVGGSDSADGTPAHPLKTLAAAILKVKPGGTIVMHAGKYPGAVINQGYGTKKAWVTLRSAPGERVILQGNPRGDQYATLYFYHSTCDEYAPPGSVCASSYWRVEDLTIRGPKNGGADSNAVKIDTQHVQIANSVLCCAVPDVVKIVRTANRAAVLDSEIYSDPSIVQPGSNSQGVDITGADQVRIVGNHFHDLPDVALYAKGNSREPIFARNRIHHTGFGANDSYNAIMLGQQTDENRLVDGPYESYDGLVVNNIITDVAGACLAASSSLNPKFFHNTCVDTAQRAHSAMLISTEGGIAYTPNKGVQMVNNLISQSSKRPRILNNTDRDYTKPTEAPLSIKQNLYWGAGAATKFVWIPDFYNERGFDAWKSSYASQYGEVDTSIVGDPLLDDAFAPSSGSPAIGAALPGYALVDYEGRTRSTLAPTIGAIEATSVRVDGRPAK
ncbi:right-handed parallel beta-helix repeat-containing protein [Ideonella sp. DXS29W]|uniref:Right-handed parallel beta-helix repeat-containing protein n=1 Tax=Ideonella lacteola TaxID=2984193 RepID=A0ABU9BL09_9BURK